MARGNTQREGRAARSEARSPEVLAFREQLSKKEMSLDKAMEKDKTLNSVFGSEKAKEKLWEFFDVKGRVENFEAEDTESGSTTLDLPELTFSIGDRMFKLTPPEVNVDYDVEDESFDYDYGSISSTEEVYSTTVTGSDEPNDIDELLARCTIKEIPKSEQKGYVTDFDSKNPNVDGLNLRQAYQKSAPYLEAKQVLKGVGTEPTIKEVEVRGMFQREKRFIVGGKGQPSYGKYANLFKTREEAEKRLKEYEDSSKLIKKYDEQYG